MSECNGVFGWLFGHDFVPNYDRRAPEKWPRITGIYELNDVLDRLQTRSYRCSVCRRCGATTKEPE